MKRIDGLAVNKYKKRIVNISISQSSLRNQGKKDLIKKTREFLNKINLYKFNKNKSHFKINLKKETKKLMKKTKLKFGAARKSLNIFLLQCSLDRVLSSFYKVGRILNYLELPLDSYTAKHLKGKNEKLPRWNGVKNLKEKENLEFQNFAGKLAKIKNIPRAYLDLEYWRNKEFD